MPIWWFCYLFITTIWWRCQNYIVDRNFLVVNSKFVLLHCWCFTPICHLLLHCWCYNARHPHKSAYYSTKLMLRICSPGWQQRPAAGATCVISMNQSWPCVVIWRSQMRSRQWNCSRCPTWLCCAVELVQVAQTHAIKGHVKSAVFNSLIHTYRCWWSINIQQGGWEVLGEVSSQALSYCGIWRRPSC